MRNKVTVATRVPGEIREALEDQVQEQGRTMSEVLQDAIIRYLNDSPMDAGIDESDLTQVLQQTLEGFPITQLPLENLAVLTTGVLDTYPSQLSKLTEEVKSLRNDYDELEQVVSLLEYNVYGEEEEDEEDEERYSGPVYTAINCIVVDVYGNLEVIDEANPIRFYESLARRFREEAEEEYEYDCTDTYESLLPEQWQTTISAIINRVMEENDEDDYTIIFEDLAIAFLEAANTTKTELSKIVLPYSASTHTAIEKLIDHLQRSGVSVATPKELCDYLIGKKLIDAGRSNIFNPDRFMVEEGKGLVEKIK
jgi:hypothetical protein